MPFESRDEGRYWLLGHPAGELDSGLLGLMYVVLEAVIAVIVLWLVSRVSES